MYIIKAYIETTSSNCMKLKKDLNALMETYKNADSFSWVVEYVDSFSDQCIYKSFPHITMDNNIKGQSIQHLLNEHYTSKTLQKIKNIFDTANI